MGAKGIAPTELLHSRPQWCVGSASWAQLPRSTDLPGIGGHLGLHPDDSYGGQQLHEGCRDSGDQAAATHGLTARIHPSLERVLGRDCSTRPS